VLDMSHCFQGRTVINLSAHCCCMLYKIHFCMVQDPFGYIKVSIPFIGYKTQNDIAKAQLGLCKI